MNLFNGDQHFCFWKLAHGELRLSLYPLIPSSWLDTINSPITFLIPFTLIQKSCLFFFLWKESLNASLMTSFLSKGSFFGNNILGYYNIRNCGGGGVCILIGRGNGECVSLVGWLWLKKWLGSGNSLEEYFRNISVHWVLHILSNKSTHKTALQQRL